MNCARESESRPAEENLCVPPDDEGGDEAEHAADRYRADAVRQRRARPVRDPDAGACDRHSQQTHRVLQQHHVHRRVRPRIDYIRISHSHDS